MHFAVAIHPRPWLFPPEMAYSYALERRRAPQRQKTKAGNAKAEQKQKQII
jgi:hypothetical protein